MKPIIYTGPMVNAILDDRKWMTRRILKFPRWADPSHEIEFSHPGAGVAVLAEISGCYADVDCPYGAPGDQLWVRETWGIDQPGTSSPVNGLPYDPKYLYRATDIEPTLEQWEPFRWHPSIHMPRKLCRLYLTITDIRVERLQKISRSDCIAEGCPMPTQSHGMHPWPEDQFIDLWDSINSKPKPVKTGGVITHYISYPWEDVQETREHRGKPWYVIGNPWIWVISFSRDDVQE